ncbi:hypothetical protein NE237_009351 [Protea cynaroides]|uniref:Protein NEDD1 n=1 Tax=Protea cynaroides TaxID=273540 RepID=A0A9Q0KY64_9MAGN|nr:hypothetical protein NE237_009351 [Protea cynaroides]
MGTIPVYGSDSGDNIDESIMSISFSCKSSRYICSGGSGQVVRIWDLQRKRCIKWLRGHIDTITGAMYNCKDEYLASISLKGDLILHNLSSGARVAELKDPKEQVLRVLDYSCISRRLLVTAGDDGSVHLWDTTGCSPKISWSKQHSAPTIGVSFSPSNDKIIASVGLDKKSNTFDSSTKRSTFCIPYEAPFSSLAFRDDGWILAAGTSSGRVVFYDVRGKPQPFTVLCAYGSSEAVTSLCWQRSKPVTINGSNCSAEIALLGVAGSRNPGYSSPFVDSFYLMPTSSGSTSSTMFSSTAEETPNRNLLWTGATLSRLQAPRTSYNFKEDMEVFSPLVDVQPMTPSLDKLWDDHEEGKKEKVSVDKNSASLLTPLASRRFPFAEDGGNNPHPISDWKFNSISRQLSATPVASSKSEDSSTTPPEVWGGEALYDKLSHHRQAGILPSRFGSLMGRKALQHRLILNFVCLTFLTLPRRFSTYAERMSTTPSFSDGAALATGSPKAKKTLAETREELINSFLSRSETQVTTGSGIHPVINGETSQLQRILSQLDPQQGTYSFTLQLVQHTLEETLASVQKSIHEDMRNLHIEILRQFHLQEMEMTSVMNSIFEKQAEIMKEVESLQKENQQLRQLL